MSGSWSALSPAIIGASVAIMVAAVTPALASLQRRRDEIHAKFDRALAALLNVQAARHYASGIDRMHHPGTDDEHYVFNLALVESSLRHFIDQTVQAREVLSEIALYVPGARQWVTEGWELAEEKEPEQRDRIESYRRCAVRSERLLRARRYRQT